MAKFRTSHSTKKHSIWSGALRIVIILVFLVAVLVFAGPFLRGMLESDAILTDGATERFYLPSSTDDPVYHKKHYSLAYNEDTEQARWVAYELTRSQLNAKKVGRSDYFKEDLFIRSGSSTFSDYKNSGYTKGHLVPAADRGFSIDAMEETFLMSNMSPQTYACNGGIWRELEEQTRDWARKFEALYIVSGPVFETSRYETIGRNRVGVPDAFFKVLLDATDPELKGIGFIIPNQISYESLDNYAMTIDKVEEKTGLDFFHELFTDKLEAEIEQSLILEHWPFSEKRFQRRIREWNIR
jgi:endonuclease G